MTNNQAEAHAAAPTDVLHVHEDKTRQRAVRYSMLQTMGNNFKMGEIVVICHLPVSLNTKSCFLYFVLLQERHLLVI